jgi:hypothetical protein
MREHDGQPGRWRPLVLALALAAPGAARAGDDAGRVVVLGDAAAPATVTLSCPGAEPVSVELQARGVARLRGTTPDEPCRLRIEQDGASVEEPLRLRPREVLRFALRGGELRLLERERRGEGLLLDGGTLVGYPSSRDLFGLTETVDAVAIVDRMDNGGLYPAEPGRIGAHGSSWTQTSFSLDGVDVTDPLRTGRPAFDVPLDALMAVDVGSGVAAPADQAGPGASLALVPRRPGSEWRGAVRVHATPGGLQSERASGPPALARYGHWRELSGFASGPLAERFRLLAAARVADGRRFERDRPEALDSGVRSIFLRGVRELEGGRQLRLTAAVQDLERPHPGRALVPGGAASESQTGLHLQGVLEGRSGSAGGYRIGAAYQRAGRDPDPIAGPTATVERLVAGPLLELVAGEESVERFDLVARYEPGMRPGIHQPAFGAELRRAVATLRPAGGALTIPETLDGRAALVHEYAIAGPESRWSATEAALYATDRIELGGRVSLALGLRYDGSWGGGVSWHALSPRLSGRLRVLPNGALALVASYGQFRHRLPLGHLAWGDPAAGQGASYLWNDRDRDVLLDPGERGALVSRLGPGGVVAALAPELEPPTTRDVMVGVEARFGASWQARFVAVHRRERDLVESLDVGAPASAYVVRSIPDPGGDLLGAQDDQQLPIHDRDPASFGLDRYLLTNPSDHSSLHEGVEFSLSRWLGERFRLSLGATASRTEGAPGNQGFLPLENEQGVVGELYDDPNADTFPRGRLFFDRAYTISLAASYRAGGWSVAGLARYQDGQPFSRLVLADLRQGPTAIRAVPNGRHRFTFTINVDLRAERSFALGPGRIAASLEAFNLLDNSNEVEEDVTTGVSFRTVTAVQPPRAIRLGLSYTF